MPVDCKYNIIIILKSLIVVYVSVDFHIKEIIRNKPTTLWYCFLTDRFPVFTCIL